MFTRDLALAFWTRSIFKNDNCRSEQGLAFFKERQQKSQDEDAMTQGEGCEMSYEFGPKRQNDGTEMTGQNDQGSKLALVFFGKPWYRFSSA